MKESVHYCGKDSSGRYIHFYGDESLVRYCGHKEIFKVKVKECENEKTNTHWSWWNNKSKSFDYTHFNKLGVTICFPYGVKIMEEENEGKLLPVIVELIE